MDLSATGLVKLLLPRTPLILKTLLLNKLSLSSNSDKQDTTTEIAVKLLRSIMNVKRSVGYLQHISLKEPAVKGQVWVAKVTIPAPEDDDGPRNALVRAIKELGDGSETYALPDNTAVQAEWTGYRMDVGKNTPDLGASEEEKYSRMMAETDSSVTILYFHGGAYFLMSPASHRGTTSHLAKMTKGRCLSVAYRLAPQHPFPAQILDALVAYLYLLSPPPESFHTAVPSYNIVFAGDSAGGNLSLALLQTLLTMQRMGITTVMYHGRKVPVRLPAGVAVNSPWCDISRSMPSNATNAKYDYLNAPIAPGQPDESIPDQLWPTIPARVQIYCDASMLTHPLVSPLAATPEMWLGCPPVFLCCGNEGLEDDVTITARRIHQGCAKVQFQGYEGMPHCFAMIFPTSPAGSDCFRDWAGFCMAAVEGRIEGKATGRWTKAFSRAQTHVSVPFEEISKLTDEEVMRFIQEAKRAAMTREAHLRGQRDGSESKPHL